MMIYLGVDPKGWLSAEVLRSSIVKRSSVPIEFKELSHLTVDLSTKLEGSTAFNRWFIPYFQNFKGRALFIEANSLVLDDIEKLFSTDMKGKGYLAKAVDNPPNTHASHNNVLLFDCEKLQHWNPEIWTRDIILDETLRSKIMWSLPGSPNHQDVGPLDPLWNQIDQAPDKTKLLHFADSTLFPWKSDMHPYQFLFLQELRAAIEKEDISLDAVLAEMKKHHIYTGLLEDMVKDGR